MNTAHPRVAALLAELAQRGIELRAEGDRLRYRPRSAVSPELEAQLKARKAEVLAALREAHAHAADTTDVDPTTSAGPVAGDSVDGEVALAEGCVSIIDHDTPEERRAPTDCLSEGPQAVEATKAARARRHARPGTDEHDGPNYPPAGADLGPATHLLAEIPVVCRVHVGDPDTQPPHDREGFVRFRSGDPGGYRHEILRCRQPDGDGLLGWAVIADDRYLEIVRECGVVKTLTVPSIFNSGQLRERRR